MLRYFVIVTVLSSASVVFSADSKPRKLEKSEEEFVTLVNKMYAAYNKYYSRADKIKNEEEREKYYADHDPSAKYVTRLIDFERIHHGTHAGLMAARRLVLLGAGGGEIGNSRDVGRRQTLKVLIDYSKADVLPEIIRYLPTGNIELTSETFLRKLMHDPHASDRNRMFAKYVLALWSLKTRDAQEFWKRQLKLLNEGQKPNFRNAKKYYLTRIATALPAEKIAKLERESIKILQSLSSSDSDLRQSGIIGIDEKWYVIDIDPEKSKSMPLVKELAAGLLFKEQFLREGRIAPDLKLQLVSGDEWSLAEQYGKTVIIQFSFKGCGPCEAMYPDLRELAMKYKEKLVILSVMADEERKDTLDAIATGKLPWNVYWDDSKGPVATQWAVTSFPTVYVVGPDGRIATKHLRGEKLKAKVAELTQ